MAVYDLEEQEKIDSLKSWWRSYGTLVTIILAAFVTGIAGVQAWNYYQKQKTEQAAELYDSCFRFREAEIQRRLATQLACLWKASPLADTHPVQPSFPLGRALIAEICKRRKAVCNGRLITARKMS